MWMDKHIVTYLYSNKKEQITDICLQPGDSQKHYAKGKKPDTKDYKLYDSIYMTF